MSGLLVQPSAPGADGTILTVTPASAGWEHVGFEVLALAPGQRAQRALDGRELCVVPIAGGCHVRSEHGEWRDLGGRSDPFAGRPDAAYLPPGGSVELEGGPDGCELGLCFAPAREGAPARVLPAAGVTPEARGHGASARTIHPIAMGGEAAESLLVCEVLTPAGHRSSYPPHKHDRDALPEESFLEETYYHRIRGTREAGRGPGHGGRAQGFGLMRVYTDDRSLDEAVAFGDRDTVLVPRGYHTVSAPPGYDLYYLNVMAGPNRSWAIANDPDHEWTLNP